MQTSLTTSVTTSCEKDKMNVAGTPDFSVLEPGPIVLEQRSSFRSKLAQREAVDLRSFQRLERNFRHPTFSPDRPCQRRQYRSRLDWPCRRCLQDRTRPDDE